MTICAPTNEPTRAMIAFVSLATRSRRLAGARRTPRLIICGSEVMKYKVRTRIVSAEKVPEITDFPTPITPPNVETRRVPSAVNSLSFACKVSINPN